VPSADNHSFRRSACSFHIGASDCKTAFFRYLLGPWDNQRTPLICAI
jgi:hypothetical protein